MSSSAPLVFLAPPLSRAMQDLRQTCISALETFLTVPSLLCTLFQVSLRMLFENPVLSSQRSLDQFLPEVEEQFTSHLTTQSLLDISKGLQAQFKERLRECSGC